jgi:hypothetical protein
MKRCISSSRRLATAFFAVSALTISGGVFAQTVDQILQADQRRLNLAQQSQERINNTVEATSSLEDQYRAINKEIDGLKVYNRLMTAQVEGQAATLEDIALSMDQVDVINRQIFPLMERMIDGLKQSVALDIPFLMVERDKRINDLVVLMERSDVTVAEKFRKVMEAYQIENDYGTSSEYYTESITMRECDSCDATTRSFNMLRIGRIGLYFQSDDTKITGRWNPGDPELNEEGYWEIDNSARNEVRKGLRMARQLIAPELIIVPVATAEAS